MWSLFIIIIRLTKLLMPVSDMSNSIVTRLSGKNLSCSNSKTITVMDTKIIIEQYGTYRSYVNNTDDKNQFKMLCQNIILFQ